MNPSDAKDIRRIVEHHCSTSAAKPLRDVMTSLSHIRFNTKENDKKKPNGKNQKKDKGKHTKGKGTKGSKKGGQNQKGNGKRDSNKEYFCTQHKHNDTHDTSTCRFLLAKKQKGSNSKNDDNSNES